MDVFKFLCDEKGGKWSAYKGRIWFDIESRNIYHLYFNLNQFKWNTEIWRWQLCTILLKSQFSQITDNRCVQCFNDLLIKEKEAYCIEILLQD